MAYKAPLVSDADCGQAKTGRRNARHSARSPGVNAAAVFDQSSLRVGLLPEIEEIAVFKLIQELLILGRK